MRFASRTARYGLLTGPANCAATYREAVNPGDRYTVVVTTTGC